MTETFTSRSTRAALRARAGGWIRPVILWILILLGLALATAIPPPPWAQAPVATSHHSED